MVGPGLLLASFKQAPKDILSPANCRHLRSHVYGSIRNPAVDMYDFDLKKPK